MAEGQSQRENKTGEKHKESRRRKKVHGQRGQKCIGSQEIDSRKRKYVSWIKGRRKMILTSINNNKIDKIDENESGYEKNKDMKKMLAKFPILN